MIVIRVELHSARTKAIIEIARMYIKNCGDSGSEEIGNYVAETIHGRGKGQLDRRKVQRACAFGDYPRKRLHVWNLVAHSLSLMRYGWCDIDQLSPEPVTPQPIELDAEWGL